MKPASSLQVSNHTEFKEEAPPEFSTFDVMDLMFKTSQPGPGSV